MDPLIAINHPAPGFELPDLNGRIFQLADGIGKIVVLNFWSAECPYAERADQIVMDLLKNWGSQVQVWTVASNANETLSQLRQAAEARRLPLILHDERNRVADIYLAQTTPHYFVLDQSGILRYRGALDDVTFRQRTPTRGYLEAAVNAMLAGGIPNPAETPAYGCSIVRAFE